MLRQFARNLFAFSLTSLLISRANAFAYYDFVYRCASVSGHALAVHILRTRAQFIRRRRLYARPGHQERHRRNFLGLFGYLSERKSHQLDGGKGFKDQRTLRARREISQEKRRWALFPSFVLTALTIVDLRAGFLLWFCADDKCVDKCTSVEWGRNPICDANDPLGWSVAVPGTTQNLASNGDNTFGSFMLGPPSCFQCARHRSSARAQSHIARRTLPRLTGTARSRRGARWARCTLLCFPLYTSARHVNSLIP